MRRSPWPGTAFRCHIPVIAGMLLVAAVRMRGYSITEVLVPGAEKAVRLK
jgi:hypothetical protein